MKNLKMFGCLTLSESHIVHSPSDAVVYYKRQTSELIQHSIAYFQSVVFALQAFFFIRV